jgi:hypothetical protein
VGPRHDDALATESLANGAAPWVVAFSSVVAQATACVRGTLPPCDLEAAERVCLFFGDANQEKSRKLVVVLTRLMEEINSAAGKRVLEVVYVSQDDTVEQFEAARSHMPWFCFPYQSDVEGVRSCV